MSLFLLLCIAIVLSACGEKPKEISAEEGAMIAAQVYYGELSKGNYESFLNGLDGAGEMGDSYRRQLIDGYREFHDRQKRLHGGIAAIEATEGRRDTTLGIVEVLLTVDFADNESEEIVVPMVLRGNQWLMRK